MVKIGVTLFSPLECINSNLFFSIFNILLVFLEYIQPTYVNMHELASMAANKAQERNSHHNEPSSSINLKVIFVLFGL